MDWQCPENIAPRPRAYQYQSLPTETKEEQRSFSDEAFLPNVPANHYSGDLAEAYGTPSVSQSHEPPQRSASTQLDDAWRLDFGIAPRWVFIAAVGDDGTTSSYDSSGRLLSPEVTSQFFNGDRYNQVIHRLEADMNPMLSIEESLLSHQSTCISQISNSQSRSFVAGNDKVWLSGRTRQRPVEMQRSDDDRMLGIPRSRTTLIIGNSDAVWNFYETEFKACQQKACKLIAKAWIKEVEPKKQSTHPYAGGDEKAPEWWPKPWGSRVSDKVRHKEPDHLYKQAHILRLVLESNDKQHPEVRKVGLNLTKLQDATWNALSPFFMENKTNALKRQHLMEIFKVAALEQKYRNGELDGATVIFINDTNDIGDSLSDIEGCDGV